MTRAPTESDESPGFPTMPAPSLPKIRGAVALGYAPDRMVWSSGLTPAAIIRTSTLPAANVGLGTSTSFRPPYPVNDSARIALITPPRSEEHTSELQSRLHLVCRLLLEKKKKNTESTST